MYKEKIVICSAEYLAGRYFNDAFWPEFVLMILFYAFFDIIKSLIMRYLKK